jgi:threonyl-tRNA synthetase
MEKTQLEIMRHSLSHVMAQAVLKLFPDAILTIGPSIDNGFYYDFDLGDKAFSPEDLKKIEKDMKKTLNKELKFEQSFLSVKDAKKKLKDNPYKLELIDELEKNGEDKISFYQTLNNKGEVVFEDMCSGPHVVSSKEIGAFKLQKIAGAYWRGDEKNKMLQRIYALAFATEQELEDYLNMLKEAEKRDHRKIGKEMKLFAFSDLVGPGLALWLPNGAIIAEELEKLAKETEFLAGYQRVKTPHIAKEEMYKTSGHLPYYAESMFPPMVMDEDGVKTTYYLKAMNCPHHHQVYAADPKSYRDLPLRLAEYGTCYRYEQSGELFGLMRVRSMNMNDAHIYCTEEQFSAEFEAVNQMYLNYFKIFGIEKYVMRFSTHDPKELGKKYVNEPELWKKTEDMVRRVLIEHKINYIEVPNEAAFYGPKIDVQVWSAIGREFSIATNQVDFAVPKRFGLTYVDKDGQEKTPLCIHRAPLGTHERFIGFLIEHYAGNFPLWLSPVQVKVISIGEKHVARAKEITEILRNLAIRAVADVGDDSVGKKIRNAEKEKSPYMLVIGDKEVASGEVNVRRRGVEEQTVMKLADLIAELSDKIKNRG